MMSKPSLRIQEGALSARNTPTQPPAETKLLPIAQVVVGSPRTNGRPSIANAPPRLTPTDGAS
jgi:hypothetical protein